VSELLVGPSWLAERLGEPAIRIVDGSWYLPDQGRDARAEYRAGHIPGAVFFDIDAIADRASGLPHMLPNEAAFAEAAGRLGLSDTDTIIVYDGAGLFSAARVWWTLRVFGARDVGLLDGGLPAWRRAGLPLEPGEACPEPARFDARLDRAAVRDHAAVAAALESGAATIVDARSPARFSGAEPEPRPGLRSGHMPRARNLPYRRLIDDEGRLAAPDAIRQALAEAGIDPNRPIVTSCGSGVTAAIVNLALARIGKTDAALYDGSWAEWGSRPDSEVATGAP
jgi:thiosulfate/3-mercaptopyruvate sulfurtransferase